jgi:hypothetical protein
MTILIAAIVTAVITAIDLLNFAGRSGMSQCATMPGFATYNAFGQGNLFGNNFGITPLQLQSRLVS